MTNFEKYKDTILEIVNMGADIAKKNGRIITCDRILCSECDFSALHSDGHCIANMFEWLYSDGSITLTKRERAFCEYMDGGYIARDMSGDLYWHNYKPEKFENFWSTPEDFDQIEHVDFDFIKWEDEEPWSVKHLLKLEVVEE